METKIQRFQNPKPRIKGGSAPRTAPGRAWGLAVYEEKKEKNPPGRGCTKEQFCNPLVPKRGVA